MLQNTFRHIRGIGPARESALWRRGVVTWQDMLNGRNLSADARVTLIESTLQLGLGDAAYFSRRLRPSDRWRVYPDFMSSCAFLDIETTGGRGEISATTVIGVLDSNGYKAFVRGDNIDEFPEVFSQYRLVVTFNGGPFDLPFLAAEFGREAIEGPAHLDLCPVLRKAGFSGGLKKVERVTRTGRASALANLGGLDAVSLWRLAQEGEPGALPTLIRYNAEDVASLPALAELAITKLAAGTPLASSPVPAFPRFDTSALPYDRSLVDYLGGRRAYTYS